MQIENIHLLRCLECGADLVLRAGYRDGRGGRILDGVLGCVACPATYPVVGGVGTFFRREVAGAYLGEREKACLAGAGADVGCRLPLVDGDRRQLDAARNWEYQWQDVQPFTREDLTRNPDDFFGENAFWKFIPLDAGDVEGKTVYITCGGRGREAFHLSRRNPRLLIVNEIGMEIHAIADLLGDWPGQLMLLRCDLCHSPLKPGVVDVSICDHGLQHVLDHRLGFATLCAALRPGGIVAICVYSHENNLVMTYLIEPSKRFVHLLPLKLQRLLALFPALLIFPLIHLVYRPLSRLSRRAVSWLPLWEFMLFWANNTMSFTWMSCFDFIHAPISYHFRRAEVEALARDGSLRVRTLRHVNGTMWTLIGETSRQ